MHRESGLISEISDGRVMVISDPTTGCGTCASKDSCMSSSSEKKTRFWTDNTINAHVGDVVIYTVDEKGVILGSMLLYILPVALLIMGALAGPVIFPFLSIEGDDKAVIGAASGLVLSFIFIGIISKFTKSSEMLQPKLESIACSSQESNKG